MNEATSPAVAHGLPGARSSLALAGRRVLVVGASSGIGAATAVAADAAGARVAVSARRSDRLAGVVEQMSDGHAIAADATSPADVPRMVAEAVAELGGLDLVVYAAGYGVLQPLTETDPDVWQSVYAVNVIGANLVAGAVTDELGTGGIMAFVSSRTVEDANGLFASYAASKAALDQCIRIWRVEHPDRRFVRIVMGNCQPTEFANQMGIELVGDALEMWERQGIPGGMMHVDDVGETVIATLGVALDHPDIDATEIKLDARRGPLPRV